MSEVDRMDVLARDREVLIGRIAAELDKPSVYMGGPSKRSLRLAEAVVRITDDHYRGAVEALERIATTGVDGPLGALSGYRYREMAQEALDRLGGQS